VLICIHNLQPLCAKEKGLGEQELGPSYNEKIEGIGILLQVLNLWNEQERKLLAVIAVRK